MVKSIDKPRGAAPRAQARPSSGGKPANGSQQKTALDWPAEGPHARDDLINEAATPGSGLFSSESRRAGKKVDPGAG